MSNTVESLLQEKGIKYTFSGNDTLIKCLNPEHNDKNPSLRVDKRTGIGHCFSCGFKTNIFKFFGVVHSSQDIFVLRIKERIQKIYSDSIGLELPMGYSLYNKEFRGISRETLNHYEAFTHKDFENRIVFPLRDITGNIRVFIGRHLYSNIGKRYDIKPAGVTLPFFPHDYRIVGGTLVLVEGIFDALNLIDCGIHNVICLNGLQTLNPNNFARRVSEFKLRGATKIILLFDGDEPGRRHTELLLPMFNEQGLMADSIDLPDDVDPGSMTKEDIEQIKKMIK